jgi:hypothetical protein
MINRMTKSPKIWVKISLYVPYDQNVGT